MSASSIAIQNSVQLYGGQSLPDIGSGDVAQLQASAQVYLDQQTTTPAVDARIASGGAAAANLIANGYNPDNADDNQQLVASIAGGLCLIPGVGPVLGAIVMGMYELGVEVIAPLVDKLFGYSSVPTCNSSGNWTTAGVLANSGVTSMPPPGTLAGLIVPAFGKAFADQMNCNAFNNVVGAVPFGYAVVIAPLLQMWNKNTGGSLVDYFVPRINASDWPGGPPPAIGNSIFSVDQGRTCTAGPFCWPEQGPYAFLPLSQVPSSIADPLNEGFQWTRVAANEGPLLASNALGPVGPEVGPHTLHLKLSTSMASSAPMSTGSKVALSAAIVAGSAAAGVGVWAFMTHQAYGAAWSRVWQKSGGKLLRKG